MLVIRSDRFEEFFEEELITPVISDHEMVKDSHLPEDHYPVQLVR